jgi:hypothetical protein
MAEYVDDSEVETELTVKVSLAYAEFYLTPEAARKLRDDLNHILNRV